jgi:hypothetical protein
MEFRKRCNKISYNLRINQYHQVLSMKKHRLEERIEQLTDIIENRAHLKYHDKYGKDGKKDELPEWSMKDVTEKQARRISLITSS